MFPNIGEYTLLVNYDHFNFPAVKGIADQFPFHNFFILLEFFIFLNQLLSEEFCHFLPLDWFINL